MSEQSTNNSTLYFIVGGLLVAVLAIGYFAMSGSGNQTDTVIVDTVKDTGTDFKLDIDKDGGISGSIEKE